MRAERENVHQEFLIQPEMSATALGVAREALHSGLSEVDTAITCIVDLSWLSTLEKHSHLLAESI